MADEVYLRIADNLLSGNDIAAKDVIVMELPFESLSRDHRSYSVKQKLSLFFRDGFIDRYSGDKLINPGFLRVLSDLFPDEFPYQTNWKQTDCHQEWWMRYPTVDHIVPIARGGKNEPSNWATTSMLHNQAKLNWTLEELGWTLHEPGNLSGWDGMSKAFIEIVDHRPSLLEDKYIANWYRATRDYLSAHTS